MELQQKKFPEEYLFLPNESEVGVFLVSRKSDNKTFKIDIGRLINEIGLGSVGGRPIIATPFSLPEVNNDGEPLQKGDWTILSPGTWSRNLGGGIVDTIDVPENNMGISFFNTFWGEPMLIEFPTQDLSGYATKVELNGVNLDLQSFKDFIVEMPVNLFNKNTVIEGYYVDATTGELRPLAPNNAFAVSDWISISGITEAYLSGQTASTGTVFKNAEGVLLKPINPTTGAVMPTYARPSANGSIKFPAGATHVRFTVKFNNVDARNTIVLESGDKATAKIRENLIPKLKEIDVLNQQMSELLYEGPTNRENKFENTINPQYYDDAPEATARFKITVDVDETSPTKDLLGYKRIFSNTTIANGQTCYQTAAIEIGAQRPSIISFAMWINKAQFQSIYTGSFINYIGFRGYTVNAPNLLAGATLIASPPDTTPIAEYTTAKCEFKIIEEVNGWIRLRITYFDIAWKSTFTGTTILNYYHFSAGAAFNKSLEVSDFTVLYDNYVTPGIFYGDPNGAYDSDFVSVIQLNKDINSLDDRVSILEQGGASGLGGLMNIKFNGDSLFIGSPYSSDRQLVKRVTHTRPTSFSNNPNLNFISSYLASMTDIETPVVSIKSEGDDITPLSINGGHIAGNHGWFRTYILTISAGHGKTFQDIGSIYKDSNNEDIVIIKIISTTQILVNGRNRSTDGFTYDFPEPIGTLVYSSNGVNTSDISGYTKAGGGNMWPSTNPSITKFFADGKEVSTDFNGKCNVFDIHEKYTIIDLTTMIEKLITSRPVGGYTQNVYFNEIGADVLFTLSQVYRYEENGNTLVMQNFYANKSLKYAFNSVIQVIALPTGNMYVPKSLPITGGATTYDFRKITPWSVNPTTQLYLTQAYWENPLSPPDRGVMLNSNILIHSGYIMDKGQAKNRNASNLSHAIHLANSRKFYPKIISNDPAITVNAGESYSAVAFRSYRNPSKNPLGRTNFSYVELSEKVYIWLDYHGSLEDNVEIKTSWSGKDITVVEKTDNINIIGDTVSESIIVISTATSDNYGYIVLELT